MAPDENRLKTILIDLYKSDLSQKEIDLEQILEAVDRINGMYKIILHSLLTSDGENLLKRAHSILKPYMKNKFFIKFDVSDLLNG
jgi:hypothetical protein